MTESSLIVVLGAALAVVSCVSVSVSYWMAYRTHRCLLHTHEAGRSVIQAELSRKQIEVSMEQVRVDGIKAEADRIRANAIERDNARRRGPTGAEPQPLTG